MAKIGIFVKNLTGGGAERQATLLARALKPTHEVYFVVFNGLKMDDKYVTFLSDNNINLTTFTGSRVNRFRQFRQFVKTVGIDVIFSYLTAANLYAVLAAVRLDTIVISGLRNTRLPWHKLIVDALITDFFATRTVANCYAAKKAFGSKGFFKRKIDVIPNCFISGCHEVADRADDKVTLISIARFVDQKDWPTAIESFAKAARPISNLRYLIAGFGERESDIRQQVKALDLEDRIEIFIDPKDIPQLLSRADIYLSTSLFEGTSNSIMEAMDAGLPVIATDVGDNAQLVENGLNGFIVPVGDKDRIADAIKILASDRSRRIDMGAMGKERLISNYSFEEFTRRYESLINSVL